MPVIPAGRKARRVLDAVEKNPQGITSDALVDYVYADDPNGGPENARVSIRVMIYNLNVGPLYDRRLKIKSDHAGAGALYQLVQI